MPKNEPGFARDKVTTFVSIGMMVLGIMAILWGYSAFVSQTDDYDASINYRRVEVENNKPDFIQSLRGAVTPLDEPQFVEEETEVDNQETVLYTSYMDRNAVIGTLEIPALHRTVWIIQGTQSAQLKKGAGHYIESAMPGESDNSVLSGHRETAFRGIGALKIGDLVIAKTSAGVFTYQVNETYIVHENDKTVIIPSDFAKLTLTTCYPFNTPGYSPDRYIVTALLITSEYAN